MAPKISYLITGATGRMGSTIVRTLLTAGIPSSSIGVTSSKTDNEAFLVEEFPGTQFRYANYEEEESLEAAFEGVEKLFFVSTIFDVNTRARKHSNVVAAAKKMGVGHVFYNSQAFGGYSSDSKVFLQVPHLATEAELKASGIPHTNVRCAIYTEGFCAILTWFPHHRTVYLPSGLNGRLAFASHDDLGAATAALMLKDDAAIKFAATDNIALLTGPVAYSLSDIVNAVSAGLGPGKEVQVEWVDKLVWVQKMEDVDAAEGRTPRAPTWYQNVLGLFEGLAAGEGELVTVLMEELLERKPRDGVQWVKGLVRRAEEDGSGGYRWPTPKKTVVFGKT